MKSKVVPLLILSTLVACLPVALAAHAQTSGRKPGAAKSDTTTRRPAKDDPLDRHGSKK